jgi:hypothetical protein
MCVQRLQTPATDGAIEAMVAQTIEMLELDAVADTLVGTVSAGLSVGERKRCTVLCSGVRTVHVRLVTGCCGYDVDSSRHDRCGVGDQRKRLRCRRVWRVCVFVCVWRSHRVLHLRFC